MKKIIFLLGLLLAGCNQAPTISLNPQFCGDLTVDNEPLRRTDDGLIGQFSFEGTVKSLEISRPFPVEVSTMEAVYLVVNNDGSFAFQNYSEMVQNGGVINRVNDGQLYMKLGVLEDGALVSSAFMDEETKSVILDALNNGKSIHLSMLQPLIYGKGATAETVDPCLIQEN